MTSPPEKRHGDDDDDDSSTPSSPYLQVPPFPPETYNYLIHALLSLQGSASPQNYLPTCHSSPLLNYNYPWPPSTALPIASPSSFYPQIPLPPRALPQSTGSSHLTLSPAASPTTAPTAQHPEETEDIDITDDKRRRNTAASARFRVKKKLKTLNLERTVADLSGRAEDLQREATDLQRENAWLKEIVLLKGRNIAVLNLGSQAPAPAGNRHDEDERNNRTYAESEPESTVKRREKGKDRES